MSETAKLRKIRNVIEARKLLSRWESSGQPFAAWCRQQGVSYQSLAAYKRYRDPNRPAAKKKTVKPVESVQFVELQLQTAPTPTHEYAIRLQNGRAIELGDSFDDAVLKRLIALVETC